MTSPRDSYVWHVALVVITLASMATVGHAQVQPTVVKGHVWRADNHAPIAGATVVIKRSAFAQTPLQSVVTDHDGAYSVMVTVDSKFVCDASAPGMSPQSVGRTINTPKCDFELESKLVLSDIGPRSSVVGRGPGLSFIAHAEDDVTLKELTIRLHLTKPMSCGTPGETLQYDLDDNIDIGFDKVNTTLKNGPTTFQMTGQAPINPCDETEIALHVMPAKPLNDKTQIIITLPAQLALKRQANQRMMTLNGVGPTPAYRSTIDRIVVDLVTSHDSMASARLPVAIPVGIGH